MEYNKDKEWIMFPKKFSVALLSHVLFLTPRAEQDKILRKAIDVVKPGGWVVIVLNSITSRRGNHVHSVLTPKNKACL